MPSSIARLIGQDHERMTRLLRRMCSAGPNQERWRTEFVGLLRAHRTAERDELLREVIEGHVELAAAARSQAERDRSIDALVVEVEQADIGGPTFSDLCDRAARALDGHGASISAHVMCPLERSTTRKEMRRMGGQYEHRRDQALLAAGGQEPPPRRLDLSRAELYELARRAGIEGRSSMSRDQLISELQRREPH